MRGRIIILLLAVCCTISAHAQVFQVDTVLYNGNPDKFINIVFLGDGYQANELENYLGHVEAASQYLFSTSPFDQYQNYFNVFAIQSISLESGAKHARTATDCPSGNSHPVLVTNNIFGSRFDVSNIHRLLYPSMIAVLNRTIADNFPLIDQNIILVNSSFYGGAGGAYATSSVHPSANEIVVHEIGHSFAQLADEYYAGDIYARELSNMTAQSNPDLVKWKNWIGFQNVGVYPYGSSGNQANWFRPHNNCKMRTLGPPFCPVCKEKLVQTILSKFGTPILSKSPAESTIEVASDSTSFQVNLLKPLENSIKVTWFLNGDELLQQDDSLNLASSDFSVGQNELKAEVLDTTSFIRADNHAQVNTRTVTWTVNKSVTVGINLLNQGALSVYPVPATNLLQIKLKRTAAPTTEILISTLHGKLLWAETLVGSTGEVNIQKLPAGTYLLKAVNQGKTFIQRFVKD
jgi:hypothetical protein